MPSCGRRVGVSATSSERQPLARAMGDHLCEEFADIPLICFYNMVLVGNRRPKQSYNAIAEYLIHRDLVALHGVHPGSPGMHRLRPGAQ